MRTGLRSGELLGLRWSDIDLRAATLTVERAVRYNETLPKGERSEVTLPKNGRTRRIALDQATVHLFTTWRHQAARGSGTVPLASAHVFGATTGHAPTQSALLSAFDRVQVAFAAAHAQAHLPRLTVHDLRHTHASLLLASGADVKVIQERLGHASATITLNTYAHLMPNAQHIAIGLLDELLRR
ncbi:site-specific integrase [Cellulomonas soli]